MYYLLPALLSLSHVVTVGEVEPLDLTVCCALAKGIGQNDSVLVLGQGLKRHCGFLFTPLKVTERRPLLSLTHLHLQ